MRAEDFINPQTHAEHARDMSGVRADGPPNMAPYPLYGIPALGQDEPQVALYKRPWFCWTGGIVIGLVGGFFIGQATATLGVFLLKKMKKNPKRKRKAKQLTAGDD